MQWIQIFDAATGEQLDETDPITGYCPAMLHPSHDGNNLFLICARNETYTRIDLNTLEADAVGLSTSGSNVGSVMSPDGTLLYVVSLDDVGFGVMVFDERSNIRRHAPLADGESPPLLGEMVTLSPDGTRLYVALGTEDNDGDTGTHDVREIAVFDTNSWKDVDRITLDVPLKGGAFAMSPDGRYIYTSERMQLDSDGKLIRIDVENGEASTVLVRDAEILRVLTDVPARPVETGRHRFRRWDR